MPDDAMFEPLAAEELADGASGTRQDQKTPIVPVPADAPPQSFRHPDHGRPSVEYEYRLATGELAGYACRFDFTRNDGTIDKLVLPVPTVTWVAAGAAGDRKEFRHRAPFTT